ncbi:sugar MFS transporter [Phocaeicola sp. KGMB11183]|uniref:Sugar MFS transporter n=1 Tax=Phocaeicola acetigenes TaxID=3016083 RepID=A0ABT4PK30_9BACT|nr:sugar MFS transporter [Phocaeicola sp. KGMB11183]MCZ8373419.1 sugar MFS transporter [Phocaeicola sp. KGMB11183]
MERNGLVRTKEGRSFLLPFILITSLFFLWGFAHSILDVLNKHFQDTMEITRTRSALIQAVVYGGYFIMALPAGNIIRRFGYRAGVLTGLVLYGVGALLFIPGGRIGSFEFFLFSLFVIGCGLTCLETAANPYVTVLGDPEGSERRLNLAQSFNGLGWICGPLVGGFFLFAGGGDVSTPYAIIGCIVLAVALVFARVKLPEIGDTPAPRMKEESTDSRGLWKEGTFTFGLVALFLYVAAQTGINSFFINYATETAGISAHEASVWLSFGGMGLFMAGRMGGSWLMRSVRAEKVLTACAIGAVASMAAVILLPGKAGWYGLLCCFLCESIMFPTIFALALRKTGSHTKRASSFLIMSIVGGAIAPILMGIIADTSSMAMGFSVPLVCFVVIAMYAYRYKAISL